MKSYTDLEQSKKLAEFLPMESADNYYSWHDDRYYVVNKDCPYPYSLKEKIPCWSFAALLDIIPYPTLQEKSSEWRCASNNKERAVYLVGEADNNPIDACYKVIIKLHELKML